MAGGGVCTMNSGMSSGAKSIGSPPLAWQRCPWCRGSGRTRALRMRAVGCVRIEEHHRELLAYMMLLTAIAAADTLLAAQMAWRRSSVIPAAAAMAASFS